MIIIPSRDTKRLENSTSLLPRGKPWDASREERIYTTLLCALRNRDNGPFHVAPRVNVLAVCPPRFHLRSYRLYATSIHTDSVRRRGSPVNRKSLSQLTNVNLRNRDFLHTEITALRWMPVRHVGRKWYKSYFSSRRHLLLEDLKIMRNWLT